MQRLTERQDEAVAIAHDQFTLTVDTLLRAIEYLRAPPPKLIVQGI